MTLERSEDQKTPQATWFNQARFGMFIHWGLYSIPAVGEWTMLNQHYAPEDYRRLADQFRPNNVKLSEWARIARDGGAEYAVFTTRHHDGFSLYDSKVSDFTSVKTAAGRDFVAEFVEACRAAGLRVGLYYSLVDWRFPTHSRSEMVPQAMEQARTYVREQVRELCTNYGQVDLLWFDGPFAVDEQGVIWGRPWPDWDGAALLEMIRRLQPGIAINDRAGVPGDFGTPEQEIRKPADGRPWEACMTMNDNWGFHRNDHNFKPTWQLVNNLVLCATGGGSYLLNIGPRADGSVPEPSVQRMRELGEWLSIYGEAVYGTQGCHLNPAAVSFRRFTRKGDHFYMFEPHWPGETERIRNFPHRVTAARMLRSGKHLTVKQWGTTIELSGLPGEPEHALMDVIQLTVAGLER